MSRGLRLLGGLTVEAFLRRHWQRKPLLVRDTGEGAFIDQRALFALAANRDVESRLSRALGTKVELKDRGNKGEIVIPYADLDALDRLLAKLA